MSHAILQPHEHLTLRHSSVGDDRDDERSFVSSRLLEKVPEQFRSEGEHVSVVRLQARSVSRAIREVIEGAKRDKRLADDLSTEHAKVELLLGSYLTPAHARVAVVVGEFVDDAKRAGDVDVDGMVILTREEVAGRANVCKSEVSRTLSILKDHGIIVKDSKPKPQKRLKRPISRIRVLQPLPLLDYLERCLALNHETEIPEEEETSPHDSEEGSPPISQDLDPDVLPMEDEVREGQNVSHNQLGWGGDGIHEVSEETEEEIGGEEKILPATPTFTPFDKIFDKDPVSFLLDIAGDAKTYIEMLAHGDDKYVTRHRTLDEGMIAAHLDGLVCVGATLGRSDGTTRSLTFDADTPEKFTTLKIAADQLQASGATSVFAPSPSQHHSGGGHLSLYFDAHVDVGDAFATVFKIAPGLRDIEECWPKGEAKVRLPGAYYHRGEVHESCTYYVGRDPLPYAGTDAIEAIMRDLTPGAWVTERAPKLVEPARPEGGPRELSLDWEHVPPDYDRRLPVAASDHYWIDHFKASAHTSRFWITTGQAATYFNATHGVAQILKIESNGKGRASWRNDNVPSVMIYTTTNTWCDFGETKPNGRKVSGDALDLHARVTGVSRSDVFRETYQEMCDQALIEFERAARDRRGPAKWVAEITSPLGWRHYEKLRKAHNTGKLPRYSMQKS
jgi:hypothetical protein